MGQELECKARFQRSISVEGKAQLETDYLVFRGPERFKINLRDLTQVKGRVGRSDAGVCRRPGGA